MWLALLSACADSPFVQAAASADAACGLQESGHVDCWDATDGTDRDRPRGRFVMIGFDETGHLHTLDDRGELVRHGASDRFEYTGRFVFLEGGCGVSEDGGVECRGASRPDGDYVRADEVCALDAEGGGWLWSERVAIEGGPWADLSCLPAAPANFQALLICGLRTDGSLDCEGAPDGVFVEVAAGSTQRCAIDDAGGVDCWTPAGPIDMAALGNGPFANLVPNGDRMCAVASGAAVCWQVPQSLDVSEPATIELLQ